MLRRSPNDAPITATCHLTRRVKQEVAVEKCNPWSALCHSSEKYFKARECHQDDLFKNPYAG